MVTINVWLNFLNPLLKFWCYLLILAPIIYRFLHLSFMSLLVPAPISENYPDTKMITDFCLSHYIEFIITSARRRFLYGKAISHGNNYTSLFMKHSCFLRVGGWRVSMFFHLNFKCWQTRGRFLISWNGYQKLYINRVRWS